MTTSPPKKTCSKCQTEKPSAEFHKRSDGAGNGLSAHCRACVNQRKREVYEARQAQRLADNFSPLAPEDFDVGIGNVPDRSGADAAERGRASAEKRQEWNREMGLFAGDLHEATETGDGDSIVDRMPAERGTYIARLAEQEYRFGNRRIARSVSLYAAAEALALRQFKEAAREYLADKVVPVGYARREHVGVDASHTVVVQFTDLHLGANLSELDNPVPFGRVQEARRLEHIVRQVIEFKKKNRDRSRLVVILGGDLIEGMLQHDIRDGAPLTEQKIIFWRLFSKIIGLLAAEFKQVLVVCQPGNHGRDKLRHPGRATSSKWDGHEWQMYFALREMCTALKNVTWDIPFRAVSIVNLHGSNLLVTHSDTELAIKNPARYHEHNLDVLDRVNSQNLYGVHIDAGAFGHWHEPLYRPGEPSIVYGGMLCPPNGHARSMGFTRSQAGQWLWEAVEGHPTGDMRYVTVGVEQDEDEGLGILLPPVDFTR